MVTTFGSFPGVRVETAGGGITAVTIGEEEKLVLFGAAKYENEGSFLATGEADPIDGDASAEDPRQINARREAEVLFGEDSKLARGMREALANGANINFLFAVAPKRRNVVDEVSATSTGTLDNSPIYEENVSNEDTIENIVVREFDGEDDLVATSDEEEADAESVPEIDLQYRYDGEPAAPTPETGRAVFVNPLTGQFAADEEPDGEYTVDYKYLDWASTLDSKGVEQVVTEDETGIFVPLTDADSVSVSAQGTASVLRGDYQLVNVISGAEPNDNQIVTVNGEDLDADFDNYQRTDARYDTADYEESGNQSVDADYYYKVAPSRHEDEKRHFLGAVGGLFAGNSISDPVYNEPLTGITGVEQSFTRTDANNMRDNNIIPIRQNGSIRVKDNTSTSTEDDWERDFWRRRIADRVILIAKQIGESIIGRINDEDTRSSAQRLIEAELRQLVNDRLLRANTEQETNWFVDVYESSTNPDEVNIDIGFTPLGIVKRVDVSITIDT